MAVGIGFDFHKWSQEKRPLVLGGVEIPFDKGLNAHSDGDVVMHALIDALAGACAMPDIGDMYPDSEERYKDIPGRELLAPVLAVMRSALRAEIINVDIVIVLEEPRLSEYKDKIRKEIASALEIEADKVGVKAKTTEGLFSGGVYCVCAVQVDR